MKYFYKTKFGTFFILPDIDNRFILSIDNNNIGSYFSAEQAAGDVYEGATGFDDWDEYVENIDICEPTDLSEWSLIQE